MAREMRIDGDRWKIRVSRERPEPGRRTVLFFPVTSDQRPYRVVEVDEDRVSGAEDLEALSERELEEMFGEASSMGFPRDYD